MSTSTNTGTDIDKATADTVCRSVVVDVPIEQAFTFFTRDIGAWWDPDKQQTGSALPASPADAAVRAGVSGLPSSGAEQLVN